MIKKQNNRDGNAHRVITFLTRDELDFLDKISKDALFSAGTKLSRSKILSAMVDAIRKLNINGEGLCSKKELEIKIFQAMKKLAKVVYNKSAKEIQHEEPKGERDERII